MTRATEIDLHNLCDAIESQTKRLNTSFALSICPIGYEGSTLVKTTADDIYAVLKARGLSVLLDDTDTGNRPTLMYRAADALNIPYCLVITQRLLVKGEKPHVDLFELKHTEAKTFTHCGGKISERVARMLAIDSKEVPLDCVLNDPAQFRNLLVKVKP